MTSILNLLIKEGHFPDQLKLAEVRTIFKKKDYLDKENYRPAIALPHMWKVFERNMFHQINNFMTDKLSKELRESRKNHSKQQCFISVMEM